MFKTLREICKKVVILGCVGYTAQEYIATPWYLEETSMEPTLKAKQIVLTTSLFNTLSRGDIVIIKSPQDPKQRVCKRIIGELKVSCHLELEFRNWCTVRHFLKISPLLYCMYR